ncbi:MAG: hypothetical protein M1813_000297 [Trichoglossum hirsutum]|nr:MAG: hypothetical protein M1813_000297 [Trichoglossum hirsutum]
MSTAKPIHRLTLFKIPQDADRDRILEFYRTIKRDASKVPLHTLPPMSQGQDGAPYILSVIAGKPFEDQRAQGYTVAAHTLFSSKEDMDYYDTGCETHKKLKQAMMEAIQGVLTVYFEEAF